MSLIATLAAHTLRENLRNRTMQVAFLFAGVLIYASLLLGALAAEQEVRVLFDFGLGFIELMAWAIAVFGAATTVLHEIETKTIYLILTRPVPRFVYLLGRYFGLVAAAAVSVLVMAALHLSLLFLRGWSFQGAYLLALLGILLKVAVAAALASFVALATTSVLSALTMIAIVWTLGHFIQEISFLARQTSNAFVEVPLLGAMYLLPNLQLMNFRDSFAAMPHPGAASAAIAAGYAAAYSAACLTLAYAWLSKKEF